MRSGAHPLREAEYADVGQDAHLMYMLSAEPRWLHCDLARPPPIELPFILSWIHDDDTKVALEPVVSKCLLCRVMTTLMIRADTTARLPCMNPYAKEQHPSTSSPLTALTTVRRLGRGRKGQGGRTCLFFGVEPLRIRQSTIPTVPIHCNMRAHVTQHIEVLAHKAAEVRCNEAVLGPGQRLLDTECSPEASKSCIKKSIPHCFLAFWLSNVALPQRPVSGLCWAL